MWQRLGVIHVDPRRRECDLQQCVPQCFHVDEARPRGVDEGMLFGFISDSSFSSDKQAAAFASL